MTFGMPLDEFYSKAMYVKFMIFECADILSV